MTNVTGYTQQTRSSEDQIIGRKALEGMFQNNPLPTDQLLVNMGMFIRSGALSKLLFLNELYEKIVRVPGDVVEFGTWWGQSLATFMNLRAIHEPYSARKVIGFDTFRGYPQPTEKDRASETIKIGGYTVSEDYKGYLEQLLMFHENENVLSHIRKFELVEGDVTKTAPAYFASRPEALVSLAFFDMALYEPTKAALEAIKDRLVKGSILAFDELNDPDYPGETEAVRDVIGWRNFRFERSKFLPARTYAIVE